LSSYIPISKSLHFAEEEKSAALALPEEKLPTRWSVFTFAVFLVSVPVFFQAPLVRAFPWFTLGMTWGWLGMSLWLRSRPRTFHWGDLLLGFTWTWLCGSIYWGWFRWEPLLHLPMEAMAVPVVALLLWKQSGKIGSWFYLGSLFGTAITDLYFYLVDLIPYWRQLMKVSPTEAPNIFQNAVQLIQTSWGIGSAMLLVGILLMLGCLPLRSPKLHWWAFGGAVLSTILVDGLFWLAATLA
jgi:Protein of unknown function (DUF3120)